MADTEALTTSIAAMAVSDTTLTAAQGAHNSPSRSNLPLPRELRDQIWRYLLRHEHVHDGMWRDRPLSRRGPISEKHQRSLSRAHTFKFHVNIIAVNKSIYEECLKVLKSNEFVIVSHKFPVTGTSKHASSLPIVTEHRGDCANFGHHVLRVHFQGSSKCLAAAQAHGDADGLISFCMVASDLSRFCRLLQHHHLYSMPPSAPFVCGSEGTPTAYAPLFEIAAPSPKGFHFRTTVQILDENVLLDTAKRLLMPFNLIVHGNQQVSFKGFPTGMTAELQQLKDLMSPSKIWVKAFIWHAIRSCDEELVEVKASAEAGDYENALKRYEAVMQFATMPYFFNLPPATYHAETAYAISLLSLTLLDAGTTEMKLLTRTRDIAHGRWHSLQSEIINIQQFMTKMPKFPLDKAITTYLGASVAEDHFIAPVARAIWTMQMVTLSKNRLAETCDRLRTLNEALQDDTHFDHDLRLLESLAQSKKLSANVLHQSGYTAEGLSRTSACQLPVQVYYTPMFGRCKVPDGLEGFVDRGLLERLKKEGFPG